MRTRLALALAATAAVATSAVPAQAAIYPWCTTRLVDAAAGANAYCYTKGPGALGNRNVAVRRTMNIAVTEGSVDAYLTCDNMTPLYTVVDAGETGSLATWGGNDCVGRLVSRVDGTTAVATSTFSFVIILD